MSKRTFSNNSILRSNMKQSKDEKEQGNGETEREEEEEEEDDDEEKVGGGGGGRGFEVEEKRREVRGPFTSWHIPEGGISRDRNN
ncbi:hypothetical protein M0802_006010 [Mischocyttarus mexicanus]|nr:hypothetical protein M0802_006010 [Mischocyttarus mexicanus]